MSNLSELLPSGGGQNVVEFTASGAVASGKPVILNSDGTVTEVFATSISEAIGVRAAAANVNAEDTAVVYDSATDKFTLCYSDRSNSDYGTYVVGTISGTSITFGTPAVFNSAASTNIDAVYDEASGNIVIMWSQAGTGGRAIVGSRSGDTLTLGSAVTFDTNSVFGNGGTYIEDAEKVFIAYRRNSAGTGHGIVGTVSGTSISFGSATTMPSSVNPTRPTTVYVGSSKAVVATRDNAASPTAGKAVVATISGTSVSFGSFTTFESSGYVGTGYMTDVTYDSANDKVVIGYPDGGSSDQGTAIVGTVSGTSISFGTKVVFDSTNIRFYYSPTLRYSVKSGNVFTIYIDANNSDIGKFVLGTVSGTSITFNTPTTFNSDGTRWLSLAVNDTTNKFVIGCIDDPAGGDPSAQIIQDAYTDTNLTAASFIGLAADAISDTASGDINVKGGINEVASPALATGTEANLTGKTQSPYPVITYDITNSKFVVFFQDGNNSNYGTSVVVTVSGTTVTFGTPVVFNSGSTNYIDATYSESNGKHLIVYPDYGNSQQATAIVGTVSGTSISFGSEQVYDTGTANTRVSVAYNSNLDKYLAGSTPSSGTINVTVLTVSGTTVSAGTPVSLSGTIYKPNIASNESASDFVLTNNKNDNQSEAHLISVSGTTPTIEDSQDLSAVVTYSYPTTGLVFLETNKFLSVYYDQGTENTYARTITVSGTSLSLGTASSAFNTDPSSQTLINGKYPLFFVSTTNAYLYYRDDATDYFRYVPITVSGTTTTSGTEVTYTSQTADYEGFLYSADAKQSLSFFQSTDSGQQTAAIAQSGVFAIGSDYYVQDDGTLSTTSSSVKVGQAISATTINMMDLT